MRQPCGLYAAREGASFIPKLPATRLLFARLLGTVRVPWRVRPGAFLLIASLPAGRPGLGVLAFGLADLGCSALLPLTISFGQEELAEKAAALAGGVIAVYQLGYGIAAFGVGPLLDGGVELHSIYAVAAIIAAAMGAWSFAVARRRPSPASLQSHPRLTHP